jgi:hypothetical protein
LVKATISEIIQCPQITRATATAAAFGTKDSVASCSCVSDGLQQRDGQAHHQRRDQYGGGQFGGHDHRLEADVEDGVGVHPVPE